jgi:hypothetical protein
MQACMASNHLVLVAWSSAYLLLDCVVYVYMCVCVHVCARIEDGEVREGRAMSHTQESFSAPS